LIISILIREYIKSSAKRRKKKKNLFLFLTRNIQTSHFIFNKNIHLRFIYHHLSYLHYNWSLYPHLNSRICTQVREWEKKEKEKLFYLVGSTKENNSNSYLKKKKMQCNLSAFLFIGNKCVCVRACSSFYF
jgi:hypothetical protein